MNNIIRPGSPKRIISHLLLAGSNPLSSPAHTPALHRQSPANPSLTPAPFKDWLTSIGRNHDIHDWSLKTGCLASGLGHSLLGYSSKGTDRIFALGRNEVGQLGISYNSQEATRGLVEDFDGDAVVKVAASMQSSYLLTEEQDRSALWVFGSLQRGRLGHEGLSESENCEEPELKMLAKATKLELPEELQVIKDLQVGFEHLLLLSSTGELYGTGCNTDGQLGLGPSYLKDVYRLTKVPLPKEVVEEGVTQIRAGADTSALLTTAGNLWTWGNSEYGQALHGRKIDQILSPLPVPTSTFLPTSSQIVDFRCGGSISILLDDEGHVYSAGFGALGLGSETLSSLEVKLIPGLEGITRIRAGWGWAVAIRGLCLFNALFPRRSFNYTLLIISRCPPPDEGTSSKIFSWGLNSPAGRLGIGGSARGGVPQHVYEPAEVALPIRELGINNSENSEWEVGEVECGQETMWATLVEKEASRE
ncbi:RCC1/BLIP-II [Meredithblackwellia eburnea MCA 4105]